MRFQRRKLGLRSKVILAAFFLQAVIVSLVTYHMLEGQLSVVEESMENIYLNIAKMAAETCQQAIKDRDLSVLNDKIEKARMDQNILYVIIQDQNNLVLASSEGSQLGTQLSDPVSQVANEATGPVFQETDEPTSIFDTWVFNPGACQFDAAVPILEEGKKLGLVRIGFTPKQMAPEIVRNVRWLLILILSVFSAGTLMAVWVDLKLRKNVAQLIDITTQMARGDLDQRVQIETADELEQLGNSFNIMAEKLSQREAENRAMREQLGAYAAELEQKVAERTQQLSEEKRKLDAIVGAVGAGLTLLDKKRNVLWANKTAEQWFGPVDQIVGRPCYEVIWGQDQVCKDCPFGRTVNSGQLEFAEKCVTRDGEKKFFQVTSSPIKDAERQVVQVVELIQDITEKKRMEAQLLQTAKMAAIGQLAAGVAHEINNPTGIISAKARLLLEAHRGQLPAKVISDTEKIAKHADRIAAIARGLLTFSRQLGGERIPVNINSVVEEAFSLMNLRIPEGRIRLQKELRADLPRIIANPGELQQVVVNLLTNAVDAMPRGGALGIRTDRASHGGGKGTSRWVTLKISDTGTGISEEVRQRMFDPFFSTKEVGKGTGLGLSISHGIIKSHGGEITVESHPGLGTTFTVKLPCQ